MKTILLLICFVSLLCNAQESFPIAKSGLKIPATWQLITVTKGREFSEGTGYVLWFQDKTNGVYAVPAFQKLSGDFQFHGQIVQFETTTNILPIRPTDK